MTVDKIRWLLDKAYPVIGSIPIAQITPHEALAVLRKVEATGAYESARRMRSVLSRVFRYGVATVRCDKDVAADAMAPDQWCPASDRISSLPGPCRSNAVRISRAWSDSRMAANWSG